MAKPMGRPLTDGRKVDMKALRRVLQLLRLCILENIPIPFYLY